MWRKKYIKLIEYRSSFYKGKLVFDRNYKEYSDHRVPNYGHSNISYFDENGNLLNIYFY